MMVHKIPDILQRIIAEKWREIERARANVSPQEMATRANRRASPPRGFAAAIEAASRQGRPAVIAEIKRASPSRGVIREDFNVPEIARDYEQAGATCLSVLTDVSFFQGSNDYLRVAHDAVSLPILRKDFIVDPYQVHEARTIGADCILLIAAVLDQREMRALSDVATDLGMDVLVEVHNQLEMDAALTLGPSMIGINNRDLHTFKVSLDTTLGLLSQVPSGTLVISESGISSPADVLRLSEAGVGGFLVGESMMREPSPGDKLRELFDGLTRTAAS
jgi:indole-3-glycerol phosphate synthase